VTLAAAREFVARRAGDRIGLVTFARYPDVICPPTPDHRSLQSMLGAVEQVEADGEEDATGIGMAVARCALLLRASAARSKVVVLLTDGEENVARPDLPEEITPLEAARLCAEHGVRVYSIAAGIGRRGPDGAWLELDTGPVRAVAEQTGGAFFAARDADALSRVYAVIDELERSAFAEPRFRYADRFAGFLAVGLALWLLGRGAGALLWTAVP
jgi:Ca-activated chloride channel family protein